MIVRALRYLSLLFIMLPGVAARAHAAEYVARPETPMMYAPADSSADSLPRYDNRWRLQLGGAVVSQHGIGPEYFPTANIDYRWTGIRSSERGFAVGPIGELGVNLLVPYLKGGLEMRMGGFFLDGHAGTTLFLFAGGHSASFGPLFFAGTCGGYMFKLGSARLELEAGFNAAAINQPAAIAYSTLAIAW
jgi:hypothetical protein